MTSVQKRGRILVVDDAEDILITLKLMLKKHFASVITESNPYHIPRRLRQESFDLVLLDMNYQKGKSDGAEGLHWLSKIKELQPDIQVIIITAHAEVDLAVEAIKRGATDFISKPWQNEKLLATIKTVLRLHETEKKVEQLQSRQQHLSAELDQPYGSIIGSSPAMQRVFEIMDKVAKTDANVLILGENGVGKELVARALHRASPRTSEIFLGVDLGAIPDTLFESELFGHKKGAFTDATTDRIGRFEAASGGTLFLDEIGNLSAPLQAKLLAALQNRQIRRLGDPTPIDIDIRLLCATNSDLHQMVGQGTFRQDLLYRINTVELVLPPLRERGEDIGELARFFLEKYSKKYQKGSLNLADSALKKLRQHRWPGNVRELQHTIERAVIMCERSVIQDADLALDNPPAAPTAGAQLGATLNLETLERQAIDQAMRKHAGNITHAAEELGLTRAALYRRLEKHGL